MKYQMQEVNGFERHIDIHEEEEWVPTDEVGRDGEPIKIYRKTSKVWYVLKGKEGAVHLLYYVNTDPRLVESVKANPNSEQIGLYLVGEGVVQPADLGRHSKKPLYEGEETFGDQCKWTDGVCYFDGSSLDAIDAYQILYNQGEEELWSYLEEYYREVFHGVRIE